MPEVPYLPLREAAERPNLMLDGAPLASTVLTLSHWPGSPTPPSLRHDLSSGSAFAWLRARCPWPARTAEAATTDHFDQDGVVALMACTRPELAFDLELRLMAVAEAGDFVRGRDGSALRASFALSSLAEGWPRPAGVNPFLDGELHQEALGLLPRLLERPEERRDLWAEESSFLDRSARELAQEAVVLEEVPSADLLVACGPDRDWLPASQLGGKHRVPVHPVALHNRSRRSRVLLSFPPRYELYFRYETWVRLVSPWPRRVDLTRAARRLGEAEPGRVRWDFNGVGTTVARLSPEGGHSDLPPELVHAVVVEELATRVGGR